MSGETATIVSDANEWIIGADASVVVGDKENNILIHTGAGQVYGEAGDDSLVAFLAKPIYRGEAIDGAVRDINSSSAWPTRPFHFMDAVNDNDDARFAREVA